METDDGEVVVVVGVAEGTHEVFTVNEAFTTKDALPSASPSPSAATSLAADIMKEENDEGEDESNDLFLKFVRTIDNIRGVVTQKHENSDKKWKNEQRQRKNYKGIDGVGSSSKKYINGSDCWNGDWIELSDFSTAATDATDADTTTSTTSKTI